MDSTRAESLSQPRKAFDYSNKDPVSWEDEFCPNLPGPQLCRCCSQLSQYCTCRPCASNKPSGWVPEVPKDSCLPGNPPTTSVTTRTWTSTSPSPASSRTPPTSSAPSASIFAKRGSGSPESTSGSGSASAARHPTRGTTKSMPAGMQNAFEMEKMEGKMGLHAAKLDKDSSRCHYYRQRLSETEGWLKNLPSDSCVPLNPEAVEFRASSALQSPSRGSRAVEIKRPGGK